jgi:hypothetical protein
MYKEFTKLSVSSQNYGFEIWNPRLFRIPDPGVKKALDPGSATLDEMDDQLTVSRFFRVVLERTYSTWRF